MTEISCTPAAGLRRRDIDMIKSLAIISVLLIHASAGGYIGGVGSFDWTSSVFWGSISRAGVPLFFMCSGALLLPPEKELTLKKLFTRSIPRIIAAMFVWAFLYKCWHLMRDSAFTAAALFQGVKEILLFKQEFHLYFLQKILLVYAFLPLTRLLVAAADKKQLEYALGLWFILAILYPTVKPFWPFSLLEGTPAQWMMNSTYGAIGYGVVGYYIFAYTPARRRGFVMAALAGFILIFAGTVSGSIISGKMYAGFYEGDTLGVCLMAAGIFGLVHTGADKAPEKLSRVTGYVSKASFCIYLVHVFFLRSFTGLIPGANSLPTLISVPLFALVMFLCSLAVYALLSRIPFVKRWLI